MNTFRKKYNIGIYAALSILFLILHYLLSLPFFEKWPKLQPFLDRLTMAVSLILIIFLLGKIIEKIIDRTSEIEGNRYNLMRITRLLTIIFVLIVSVSFLFQNLYAAAVSFGVISLVLGFALQAPITSFIAWLYIVFRKPYQVGDRIQLSGMKGDVIEIHYLDTIMQECSGGYLQNDRKSGRIIHFPNSLILKSEVINYSGPFIPFIWNETPIQIAYTSDIQFVEKCLIEAAIADFKTQYPQEDISENSEWMPAVYFRINSYAWMEAVISYPVEPEDTTGRRNRILRNALPLLNQHPDKVKFPEGTSR